MTAITHTSAATADTIDSGTDYAVLIVNSGTVPVYLTPSGYQLKVGQQIEWETQGAPIKGYVDSTAGAVTVTALAAPYKRTGKTVADNSQIAAVAVAAGAQAATAAAGAEGAADAAGSVTVTSVASPVAGVVATVTFGEAWGAAPHAVILQPRNAAADGCGLYVSAKSATAFTVSSRVAAGANAVLLFDYAVTG